MKLQYSLRSLFLWTLLVGLVLSLPAVYGCGRYHGAAKVFDATRSNQWQRGPYALVPLYEGGRPAAILWVMQDVSPGEDRHVMVRKPGSGAHWMLHPNKTYSSRGLAHSDGGDYLEELLATEER